VVSEILQDLLDLWDKGRVRGEVLKLFEGEGRGRVIVPLINMLYQV